MQEFAGVYSPDSDLSSGDVLHDMRMTRLVQTSQWHTDGFVGGGGRVSAESSQGFYVLNDNPHAYFEMNDCIPILKGNFITFNGRKPHRTVIADGSFDLLGPFDLHSLKCVEYGTYHTRLDSSGKVKGAPPVKRQLGEETTDTERLISGRVFSGVKFDGLGTNEIFGHNSTWQISPIH
jgi:hypothetical protein